MTKYEVVLSNNGIFIQLLKNHLEIGFYSSLVRISVIREFIEKMAQAKKSYLASLFVDPIANYFSVKQ